MKKKSFEKKLSFNKATVANLEENVMGNVIGGIDRPVKITYTCPITFGCSTDYCVSVQQCPETEWLECTNMVC